MNQRAISMLPVLFAGLALPLLAGRAMAVSFTLDFQNPTGVGSSFADAISLSTSGAAKDLNGAAIGFTRINGGDTNLDGKVGALTLGAGGLAFIMDSAVVGGDSRSKVVLAVPLSTMGIAGEQVKITARFTGVTGFDTNFEQAMVGIGDSGSTASGSLAYSMLLFASPNIRYQTAGAPGNFDVDVSNIAHPTNLTMSLTGNLNPAAVNNQLAGNFTDNLGNNINKIADDNPNYLSSRLNRPDTYGYLVLDRSGGAFSGTLTSITFEGPNITLPGSVIPVINVPIVNPSFEVDAVGDGAFGGTTTGWTHGASAFAVHDPQNGRFAGTSGDNTQGILPDGGQLFNLDVSPLSQTLAEATQANTRYSLSFFLGRASDATGTNPFTVEAEILDNGVAFATAIFNSPAVGSFQQFTLEGITGGSVGGTLSIRFRETSTVTTTPWLDAVVLTRQAIVVIPEPATLLLGMAGLAAIALPRRRQGRGTVSM